MVWQTLTDNPEVFYGAVLSLVIVVLLTPAAVRFRGRPSAC